VKGALEAARRNEPAAIEQEISICEIPAPPFHEETRAQELKRLFISLGLRDVRIDKAGNVIGARPGKTPHPNLVFAAHLDTAGFAG
jgi:putative aminopeptidase FrvX